MFKLEIYVPESHGFDIIEAISKLGAARLGNYDHVASITHVKGFWRPLEGADPYDGEVGKISCADEVKIETICPEGILSEVIGKIKDIHPYEEPLINILRLEF